MGLSLRQRLVFLLVLVAVLACLSLACEGNPPTPTAPSSSVGTPTQPASPPQPPSPVRTPTPCG